MKSHITTFLVITMLVGSVLPVLHAAEARENTHNQVSLRSERVERPDIDRIRSNAQVAPSRREPTRRIVRYEVVEAQTPEATVPREKNDRPDGAETDEVPFSAAPEELPAAEPVDQEPAEETPTKTPELVLPDPEPAPPAKEPVVEPPQTTPNPESAPSVEEPTEYAAAVLQAVHRLTNEERKKAGVPALAYDEALAAVAAKHSEDMALREYFSHDSPEGCDAGCRLHDAGYTYVAWGENIAWISSFEETSAEELAEQFVESWLDSAGHRRNMLSDNFTHEGIGIAEHDNRTYITVNFAHPW